MIDILILKEPKEVILLYFEFPLVFLRLLIGNDIIFIWDSRLLISNFQDWSFATLVVNIKLSVGLLMGIDHFIVMEWSVY